MAFRRYRSLIGSSYSNPAGMGQSFSQAASMGRGFLLAELMRQGKLKPQDLSAQDVALAGPELSKVGNVQAPGVFGGIGGIVGNLGRDLWDVTKGLGPGLYQAGKSVAYDVSEQLLPGIGDPGAEGSDVVANIAKPMVDQYKYYYGGVGAPEGESFWDRLAAHPLQPILDAATVASLGAGASATVGSRLANAGRISATNPLARLGSTARSPLSYMKETPEGTFSGTLDREFSRRPLRKGIQILTDKAANRVPAIENFQRKGMRAQRQRYDFDVAESQSQGQVRREASDPLVEPLSKLDADEAEAFNLLGRLGGKDIESNVGLLNTSVQAALRNENPEGANISDFAAIDPKLAESRTTTSPRALELAKDPTSSPALMNAMTAYRERVESRIIPDLNEDAATVKQYETLDALGRTKEVDDPTAAPESKSAEKDMHRFDWNRINRAGEEEGIYVDDLLSAPDRRAIPDRPPEPGSHPFPEPTIMPSDPAVGFEYKEPGWFARKAAGREGGFQRDQRGRTFNPTNVTYRNLLEAGKGGLRPNPNPVLAGVHRPDVRQYVDFIAQKEREKIESSYSEKILKEVVLKDENGEPVTIPGSMNMHEVRAKYGDNVVPVSPDYFLHWYKKETTVADAIGQMQDLGYDVKSTEMGARMMSEAEDTALDTTFAAQRMPAWLAPKDFMEYQYKLNKVKDPYSLAPARALARAHQAWKAATLAMMPRWALNTVVGGIFLNTVKGVTPLDYLRAYSMRRARTDIPITDLARRPERKLQIERGPFADEGPAGVEFGGMQGAELLDTAAQGMLDSSFGIKIGPSSRWAFDKVQRIDNHFRRASFVHSLRKESQAALNEQGTIIEDFESGKGARTTEQLVAETVDNPEMMRRTIEDVNRYAYNFSHMGPAERRYVRQLVPFWGWYKFISSVAYRLPVDYPGRTALMAQVGRLGSDYVEQEYGSMPGWLKGAIPLSGPGQPFSYLSTMGLNPFSQIANPASPEGLVGGLMQLGQMSPVTQAFLSAYGLDTLRGGETPISPETMKENNVGQDMFGSMVDQDTGEQVNTYQVAPGSRLLGGLIRAFPQARIMERFRTGGRSVFPESVPWDLKPMGTNPETQFGGTMGEVLQQVVGVAPRPYDLESAQRLAKQRALYARTQNRNAVRKLRKKLNP